AALAPTSAAAAAFTCEASVLSGTIATAPAIEPLITGRGEACKTASVGLPNLSAPLGIVGINALAGATSLVGDPNRQDLQQAVAGTSIADIKIGSLGGLGLPLPALPLPALPAQTIDISAITGPLNGLTAPIIGGLLGPITGGTLIPLGLNLPTSVDVDINAAVQQLLKLPNTDVLKVKAATTLAGASCLNGSPVTAGSSTLAGVSVLGNELNVDTIGDQAILDTQQVNLANLDPNLITIPTLDGLTGSLLTTVTAQVNALVLDTLKALPPISVPVDLLRVQVSPGSQAKTATSLTQNGPGIRISALGQPVVDLQLGQSKVGTAGVDCTPPKPPTKAEIVAAAQAAEEKAAQAAEEKALQGAAPVSAAAAALACTTQRLVLTDVVAKGSRVRIFGVADKRFAGQTVKVVFEADGKTAARAKVQASGEFLTTAKLPTKKLRSSNKARYRAQIGTERSRNLKLARRLFIDRARASGGRVRLVGHVTGPLGAPLQTITLTRRVSCKKSVVVKRFKPRKDGTFSVLVEAPEGAKAQVYRFGTKVRKTRANKKLFPTFTLPTGVDLT
ncbi:MAG: hypothetical protein H0V81_10000, partial [Solirubrobacterales bacterium]|nr:hypothetical protein [Solirubrobacterales bacterium]